MTEKGEIRAGRVKSKRFDFILCPLLLVACTICSLFLSNFTFCLMCAFAINTSQDWGLEHTGTFSIRVWTQSLQLRQGVYAMMFTVNPSLKYVFNNSEDKDNKDNNT